VFPLREGSKEPLGELVPRGVLNATTKPDLIRRWWVAHPDANVGIACGPSGLIVVDCDVKNGVDGIESWRDLDIHGETWVCETPSKGLHLYYAADGHEVRNSASRVGPGIDIRAQGGYVVAPPSTTPAGDYGWALDCRPNERELLPVPEALLALLDVAKPRATQGNRNDTLTSLAGAMRRKGMGQEAIEAALAIENAKCQPPLPASEVAKIAASVARYEPAVEPEHLTDLGNARRFARQYEHEVRYCHTTATWYLWDGRRWHPDLDGQTVRLAKQTVASIYVEASKANDDDSRKAIAKWAVRSEAANRIQAMLELAQSEPAMAVIHADFDADPWLLNVVNGTLDLRSGELKPHDPHDMITRLAPVVYDPGATLPLWQRFLGDATGQDGELTTFLQRVAGYTLTGSTAEEVLLFVHGPTNSGKSTFLEALKSAMGDYATTADFETFLQRSFVGSPRPDIARLAGARFVASVEVDEGKRLAEGLVKQLTGGDTVTARHLYKAAFEFQPQFKLWLAANSEPRVSHDDAAMWRRIVKVPFDITVPPEKRDPTVKSTLKDQNVGGPAILAWAVAGCLAWQQHGLAIPKRVRQATEQYRHSQDPLRDWIADCCVLSPTAWTSSTELRQSYETWGAEQGISKGFLVHGKRWGDGLRGVGCQRYEQHNANGVARGWLGIGLAQTPPVDEPISDDRMPF
jgi:putative DNA primase/helicase